MKRIAVTLKNYRCFSDEEPARFEIGPGFTAILGPNNAGKSTLMLLFYELQNIFKFLAGPVDGNLSRIFQHDWSHGVEFQGVIDQREVFHDQNERALSIELEVITPDPPEPHGATDTLKRVVMTCDQRTRQWRFATHGTKEPATNHSDGEKPPIIHNAPNTLKLKRANMSCNDFSEAMQELAKTKYYGAFRNPINAGGGALYDLAVGTAFVDVWDSWKTHGNRMHMARIEQVTEDIRKLFGFGRLEINRSPNLNTLMVKIDGRSYRLAELGAGIAQFIMVLGNAATNPASILFIDEPETNLHPSLQQDFLLSLASYASIGVFFSTHSVGLARSVAHPIFSIQRKNGLVSVKPLEATRNYLEFMGELSFSTFKDLGHDRVLLVEGVNDVRVLQQFLRLVGKDHTTVVLNLGGDQLACANREPELSDIRRLSDKVFALVDSERSMENEEPIGNRKKFLDVCNKLGIKAHATTRRAIENYFPLHAVKAVFGEQYQALDPYERLKSSATPWDKGENWRVARAMTKADLARTDLLQFLEAL